MKIYTLEDVFDITHETPTSFSINIFIRASDSHVNLGQYTYRQCIRCVVYIRFSGNDCYFIFYHTKIQHTTCLVFATNEGTDTTQEPYE